MDPSILLPLVTVASICREAIAKNMTPGNAIASVYGNRTDGVFCWIVSKTWDFFTKGEENVSPQLQQAARKAYLQATRDLCTARLQQLGIPSRKRHRNLWTFLFPPPEVRWLDKVRGATKKELQQVAKRKNLPPSPKVEQQIAELKEPKDETNEQRRQELIEKLKLAVIEEFRQRFGDPPDAFEEMVMQGWDNGGEKLEWLDYFSKCLEEELNKDTLLLQKVDSVLLSELRSQGIPVSLEAFKSQIGKLGDRMDRGFKKLGDKVDKVDDKLDKVDDKLDKADGKLDKVDDKLDKIIEYVTPKPPKSTGTASSSVALAANPFYVTPDFIKNSDYLLGREELLRRVFEKLDKGQNVSLVGPEHAGKSFTLEAICKLGPERLGLPPQNFINLNLLLIEDEEGFKQELYDRLNIKPKRLAEVPRILKEKRYIICLDEVQTLKKFSKDIIDWLSGLAGASERIFRLVLASQRELQDLLPNEPTRTSPLAGLCKPSLAVEAFSTIEKARKFLDPRLQGTGVTFSDDNVRELLVKSSGCPGALLEAAADMYAKIVNKS